MKKKKPREAIGAYQRDPEKWLVCYDDGKVEYQSNDEVNKRFGIITELEPEQYMINNTILIAGLGKH
jgi:hypothetical protein